MMPESNWRVRTFARLRYFRQMEFHIVLHALISSKWNNEIYWMESFKSKQGILGSFAHKSAHMRRNSQIAQRTMRNESILASENGDSSLTLPHRLVEHLWMEIMLNWNTASKCSQTATTHAIVGPSLKFNIQDGFFVCNRVCASADNSICIFAITFFSMC